MDLLQYLKSKKFHLFNGSDADKIEKRRLSDKGLDIDVLVIPVISLFIFGALGFLIVAGVGLAIFVGIGGLFYWRQKINKQKLNQLLEKRLGIRSELMEPIAKELYNDRGLLGRVIKEMMDFDGTDEFKNPGNFDLIFLSLEKNDYELFKLEIGLQLGIYWAWHNGRYFKNKEYAQKLKELIGNESCASVNVNSNSNDSGSLNDLDVKSNNSQYLYHK